MLSSMVWISESILQRIRVHKAHIGMYAVQLPDQDNTDMSLGVERCIFAATDQLAILTEMVPSG